MSDADVHIGRFSAYDVVRILLGLVLLTAAGLKGYQLATEPVVGNSFLDSRWFLIGVVEFELLFGLWLMANLHPKLSWALALACFACFGCISAFKALSGEPSCGCFGRVAINPWYTLAIDVSAVVALLRWRPNGALLSGRAGVMSARSRLAWIAAVWVVASAPLLVLAGSYETASAGEAGQIVGNGQFVVLEPETWVGKPFPLLKYIDVGKELAKGEWVVLLYHHECPKCRDAIPQYVELSWERARRPDAPRVALVEIPPYVGSTEYLDVQSVPYVLGRLDDEKEWFVTTPVEIVLDHGAVSEVFCGGVRARQGSLLPPFFSVLLDAEVKMKPPMLVSCGETRKRNSQQYFCPQTGMKGAPAI